MNTEQQKIEYKSLQKIRTGEKEFKELSTTCGSPMRKEDRL